jgi:hypothetical protein
VAWLSTSSILAADAALTHSNRGPASPAASLPFEPIHRLKIMDGKQRFATRSEIKAGKLDSQLDGMSFLAVYTNEWPAGLVPVFAVEKPNRFELRRRPPRGHENSSDPLFFALPPEDEPDAARITGRWQCDAVRGDNSKAFLAWELTIDGDHLAGRFDPNTEYRHAYLVGGTFRSNRLELRVEYIMDAYLLVGEWHDGKLKGMWRRADDSEAGTWEASREQARVPSSQDTVPLYEWRRPSDDARRYALTGEPMEPAWERLPRPLCRVWRAPAKGRE